MFLSSHLPLNRNSVNWAKNQVILVYTHFVEPHIVTQIQNEGGHPMGSFAGGFCEENFFFIILVLFILLVIVGAGIN
jgi:uncharacterized protein (TIGR01732 family)